MRTRNLATILCLAALGASVIAQAQTTVYRWVDKNGKVQFSDSPPPPDATNSSQKSMGGGGAPEEQVPFATQMATKRNPVVLYTSNDCGAFCAQGRELLAKRGVPYSEKNAQKNPADAEALQKLVGALQVPVLVIGETPVRGFDEENWQSALDRGGYARTRLPGQAGPRPTDAAPPPTK